MHRIEGALTDESRHVQLSIIRKLVQSISYSCDVPGVLEELYQIEGFDRFALGLMWVMSTPRSILRCECEETLEYDAETLSSFLGVVISGSVSPFLNLNQTPSVSSQSLSEQMHHFGRFIAEIKRRLTVGGRFQGFEEDLLYRLIDEMSGLQKQAVREGNNDIKKFGRAFIQFLEFVIHEHRLDDPRVLSLMETANVTMQTVSATPGAERGDSLDRAIELLENPGKLFA